MKDGHALTRAIEDNPRLAQWRQAVAQVAADAYNGPLLSGPVGLRLVFIRPRPKAFYGTGRNAGRLKAGAPFWPTTRPDLLKLARAVEDALTGVIWRDDAQIVVEHLSKKYGERFAVDATVALIQGANYGTENHTGKPNHSRQG